MTTDQQTRLLALATVGAEAKHFAGLYAPNQDGHTGVDPLTCEHPNCRLVREVSLEPSREANAPARALILRHEGCRLKPYVDTAAKITIGVGRNLTDRGISQRQADDWLDEDVADCVNVLDAYPWFGLLSDVRKDALIDLVFNVGAAGFTKFHRLQLSLIAENYDQAADEIIDSRLAPARAAELAAMIRTGRWPVETADEGREP